MRFLPHSSENLKIQIRYKFPVLYIWHLYSNVSLPQKYRFDLLNEYIFQITNNNTYHIVTSKIYYYFQTSVF